MEANDDIQQAADAYFAEEDSQQEELEVNPDVDNLFRAWRCEKAAPELLPYETAVIGSLLNMVARQQASLDAVQPSDNPSINALYFMDVARLRYLLTAYHRTRVAKIQRWALHLSTAEGAAERMSPGERDFLAEFVRAKMDHLDASVLSHLPPELREIEKEPHVLDGPNPNVYVFARVIGDVGAVPTEHHSYPVELGAGDGLGILYDIVRPYVLDQRVHLF